MQLDGPEWREKLPPIPSFTPSNRPVQPASEPKASAAPKAEPVPKMEKKESNEQLFEKMKLEGNEHVKKVYIVYIWFRKHILVERHVSWYLCGKLLITA